MLRSPLSVRYGAIEMTIITIIALYDRIQFVSFSMLPLHYTLTAVVYCTKWICGICIVMHYMALKRKEKKEKKEATSKQTLLCSVPEREVSERRDARRNRLQLRAV